VQWNCEPDLDGDGNVIGFKDTMKVTPSHRLSAAQAAAVKSVTTKSGNLKLDVHDKHTALQSLAKILGFTTEAAPVQQVNVQ
jgi:hypothetical protein